MNMGIVGANRYECVRIIIKKTQILDDMREDTGAGGLNTYK